MATESWIHLEIEFCLYSGYYGIYCEVTSPTGHLAECIVAVIASCYR